jgi:hypothetical protein
MLSLTKLWVRKEKHFNKIFAVGKPGLQVVIQELTITLETTFVGAVVGKLQILNATEMQIRVM